MVENSTFKFHEVTDIEMKVDASYGDDVGVFEKGQVKREFFVVYEGPEMDNNRIRFFDELKYFIDQKVFEQMAKTPIKPTILPVGKIVMIGSPEKGD